MSRRTVIIVILTISTILAIGLGILFQNLRTKVEPKPADIQQSVNEVNSTLNQASTTVQNVLQSSQQPSDSTSETTTNIIANNVEITTSDYTKFVIQTLNQGFVLVQIDQAFYNSTEYLRVSEIESILPQDNTYDTSRSFFILNQNTGQIFFLGYGFVDLFESLTINNQNYWIFKTANYAGRYQIYTVDDTFNSIYEHTLPRSNNVRAIYFVNNTDLTVTYLDQIDRETTSFIETSKLSDLKINTIIDLKQFQNFMTVGAKQ